MIHMTATHRLEDGGSEDRPIESYHWCRSVEFQAPGSGNLWESKRVPHIYLRNYPHRGTER